MCVAFNDAIVLAHIDRMGVARTWMLASKFDMDTADMRRRLQRLEREGKVRRVERYTNATGICWALPTPNHDPNQEAAK